MSLFNRVVPLSLFVSLYCLMWMDGGWIDSVFSHCHSRLDGLISLAGGTVEGSIAGASRAIVALIPDPPNRAIHLYRASTADENGNFTISGIAPGSCRLFAWSKLNGVAYKNAEFMKSYDARGTPIIIERNGRVVIQTKLLE